MNEKENIPTGPVVDQFPKYRFYNTVEELYLNESGPSFWGFKQMFNAYTEAADKAGKQRPVILIKHALTPDGRANGSILVNTIEELEKVLGYCPWNSTVHIGYYVPCRVDD